ncbi:GNAT family N-acetyltransferase [Caldivirga maquilingensis]|uniref:GCN5-related N-acetyltransferase n=1 Tax=Caldivirga maquilingensis (strain ATCC 700844 / DSM 13496 / JCM 10307 / IC-167) TaxID=397948 RepID=A8MBA9_CALMQ|nr:GNAT family N-acetyltransferase [Caldivirga maquilingensis]ABW01199.1 GCN5-related N-acetyltransferase [Caldivirga maquilingensis IC-167]
MNHIGIMFNVRYLDPLRDGELVISFYKSLSRQSIRSRFLCMMNDVEECVKSLLSSKPIIYGVYSNDELIAVGEAYRVNNAYEIALAVKDEYQGRGIGKWLVGLMLKDLFNRGAVRVYAYMSLDNIKMVRISKYYGGKVLFNGDSYKVVFDSVNLRLEGIQQLSNIA